MLIKLLTNSLLYDKLIKAPKRGKKSTLGFISGTVFGSYFLFPTSYFYYEEVAVNEGNCYLGMY